ncbi:MAG: 2-dehydropantoate 2-reductase [Deltaproteobacteria bacterium]|nr:2-dehydropantoate 2-reductase [Deltaproteobacteria bacterium]
MESINILVYGAGAVGIYFGGKLCQSGFNVVFVDTPEKAELLNDSDMHIRSKVDKDSDFKAKVVADVGELPPQDLILVCVKAFQTYEIALNLLPVIKPSTLILSLQNGLENEKILSDLLGENLVMGAVLNFNGKLIDKSTVMQFAPGKVIFGEMDHQRSEREEWLSKIFAHSDINHTVSNEITKNIWLKFIWNNAFNAISALTHTTVGQILESEAIQPSLRQMMEEAQLVAQAEGVEFSKQNIEDLYNENHDYGDVKTPMLKDIESGVVPELEPLVGTLIQKAKQYDISAPVNKTIYNLIRLSLSKY